MTSLESIKKNLKAYLGRYYLITSIQGVLLVLATFGTLWLALILLESTFRFGSGVRAFLFLGFLASLVAALLKFFIVPILKTTGIVSRKSDKEAATEIGHELPEVQDQLLNILNLEQQAAKAQNSLFDAGLRQKASAISGIDFRIAIPTKVLLSRLRWMLVPIGILIAFLLIDQRMITDSSARLVKYDQQFLPPAPFQFALLNPTLEVAEGEDITIEVKASGSTSPQYAFIESGGQTYRMKGLASGLFSFTFKNVRSNTPFSIQAGSVQSENFEISVLAKPTVLETSIDLVFPAYVNRSNETVTNRNQILVPEGTQTNWKYTLRHVDALMLLEDSNSSPLTQSEGSASHQMTVISSTSIGLITTNKNSLSDTTWYQVQVDRDELPTIQLEEHIDSSRTNLRFFNGLISDDYGFTKLEFHTISTSQGEEPKSSSTTLDIDLARSDQALSHIWNFDSLIDSPGQKIEYYFKVWDNDGVNGAKSVTSQVWTHKTPSLQELKEESEEQADETQEALKENSEKLSDMDEKIEALRKELLENKKPNWEDREEFKSLLEEQKKMVDELQDKAEDQKNQQDKMNRFNQMSEQLMDKQARIQEMFDKLFDEEFKEKYEEWNELLEEMSKEDLLKKLDEMELDHEQLEKELDRTLELFKQLEFEQKLEETISKADELQQKQEDLREKTEDKSASNEDLKKEQDELSEDLKDLSEELDKLSEMNEALEEPAELPDTEDAEEAAKSDMNEASEELEKNNQKKASPKQKSAEENLEKMGDQLQSFQQQQAAEQHAEDLDDMRQLLENIVDLSHAQEELMEQIKPVRMNDPKYVELAKNQKDVIDDVKVVEDSLLALSKRVVQLDRVINDEITSVKHNMEKALSNLTNQPPNQEKRYKEMASQRQQLAMTSLNNLALLFDEIIRQMQSEMAEKNFGKGACKNPGNKPGGKPSPGDMKKMQQNLNKQLQKLKEAMEKGESPNGKKPGQQPGMGGMSKQLSQMAAQQAFIREQLRQLSESIDESGEGGGSNLKEIEKLMEKTEEDILYGTISQQTLNRQQEILTKLLESEKADRERELDKQRTSETSKQEFEIPEDLWEEYIQNREEELELYKTVPANLKPFYRNQVNRYFSTFSE